MVKYGLVIDLDKCIGCYGCVIGCKNWHNSLKIDNKRKRLIDFTKGEYPNVARFIFPVACMQCEIAPCISVCQFGATYRDKNNIIVIDNKKCKKCELCIISCPYNARYLNLSNKLVDGCDFCSENIEVGLNPYCVETCPTQAMFFGDLADPNTKISKYLKSKKVKSIGSKYRTSPRVFYANLHFSEKELSKIPNLFKAKPIS